MKYLLLLLALASYGCKKCADCTTTVTQQVTGQQAVIGYTYHEECGSDLKEVDGKTTTSTATVGGYTATITTKTECR